MTGSAHLPPGPPASGGDAAPADPYASGLHRWWYLSAPSPELVDAEADGWLGPPGVAVDLGCGLGAEVGYLASKGWAAIGVDHSGEALARAAGASGGPAGAGSDGLAGAAPGGLAGAAPGGLAGAAPGGLASAAPGGLAGAASAGFAGGAASVRLAGAAFLRSDVLAVPLAAGAVDLLLDRGCFHYLPAPDRRRYAAEARRLLRPGGGLLLRACLTSAGEPNGMGPQVVEEAFRGWVIEAMSAVDIPSDTRTMPALVCRLRAG